MESEEQILCTKCQHSWDDHVLEGIRAEGEAPLGGRYYCPVERCACQGTWDVPPEQREEIERYNKKQRSKTISLSEVKSVFQAVLRGEKTREEAADWAIGLMQKEDTGDLTYEPLMDEDRIWTALQDLSGIDLKKEPNVYFHSSEDIQAFMEKVGDAASV